MPRAVFAGMACGVSLTMGSKCRGGVCVPPPAIVLSVMFYLAGRPLLAVDLCLRSGMRCVCAPFCERAVVECFAKLRATELHLPVTCFIRVCHIIHVARTWCPLLAHACVS